MSLIIREDLDEVERHIESMPRIAAGMYAPVLLAWCRVLLDEMKSTKGEGEASTVTTPIPPMPPAPAAPAVIWSKNPKTLEFYAKVHPFFLEVHWNKGWKYAVVSSGETDSEAEAKARAIAVARGGR